MWDVIGESFFFFRYLCLLGRKFLIFPLSTKPIQQTGSPDSVPFWGQFLGCRGRVQLDPFRSWEPHRKPNLLGSDSSNCLCVTAVRGLTPKALQPRGLPSKNSLGHTSFNLPYIGFNIGGNRDMPTPIGKNRELLQGETITVVGRVGRTNLVHCTARHCLHTENFWRMPFFFDGPGWPGILGGSLGPAAGWGG